MMSLSKLWLFVLTLLSGLLLLAFLLSPAQVKRSLDQSGTARMELAQQSASLLLQNSARMWVDTSSQLAGDAILQSTLEELSRGQSELELLHRTAQAQMKKINETLKVSFIILTDARGRVLARAGLDEEAYKDPIDGFPLVVDAIRGYRLDDMWFWEGALYRVAAAPVVSSARDRYVGAVILGQVVSSDLAEQLHAVIGVDVAFLCQGKVMAASVPRSKLPEVELGHLSDINSGLLASGGHTQSAPIHGEQDQIALLTGLPGEAAAQGSALVLLSPSPVATSLGSLLSALVAAVAESDLPLEQIPYLGVGMILSFLLGVLLVRTEAEDPFARLLGEVRAMGRKRAGKVEEKHFSRGWRELALAINTAVRSARPDASGRETSDELGAPKEGSPPSGPADLSQLPPLSSQSGLIPPEALSQPAALRVTAPNLPLPMSFATPPPMGGTKPAGSPPSVRSGPFAPPSAPVAPGAEVASRRKEGDSSRLSPHSSGATLPVRLPSSSTGSRASLAGTTGQLSRPSLVTPLSVGDRSPSADIVLGGEPTIRAATGDATEEGETASSKTLHDPTLEEEIESMREPQESPPPGLPTVRDIPSSLVQAAIESALASPPAPFKNQGSRPAPRSGGPPTGPISSAPPPMPRTGLTPLRPVSAPPAPPSTRSPVASSAGSRPGANVRSPFDEATAVADVDPKLIQATVESDDELDAAFRQTYQEFVVTKQRCNEPVEGLTFDKFAVKLRQSREQILKQHNCKAVRFHVYVKDGKAALKATPVAR